MCSWEGVKCMTKMNISTWKEFRVGDLFDVYNGKKYPKDKRILGDLHLVSNTVFNNGIDMYIEERNDSVYSNFISVAYGSGTGVAFYHSGRHFVGETVMALVPRFDMSENIGEFVSVILTSYGKQYFTYDKKPKVDEYRTSMMIMLPATENGEPDWSHGKLYS